MTFFFRFLSIRAIIVRASSLHVVAEAVLYEPDALADRRPAAIRSLSFRTVPSCLRRIDIVLSTAHRTSLSLFFCERQRPASRPAASRRRHPLREPVRDVLHPYARQRHAAEPAQ